MNASAEAATIKIPTLNIPESLQNFTEGEELVEQMQTEFGEIVERLKHLPESEQILEAVSRLLDLQKGVNSFAFLTDMGQKMDAFNALMNQVVTNPKESTS